MAAIYSTLLWAGAVPTAAGAFYTPPAGFVAVVRDVELYNNAAGTATINLWVYAGTGPVSPIAVGENVPGASATQWQGRVVLPQGYGLCNNGAIADFYATISGYLLSAP